MCCAHKRPGRRDASEVTIFDSVGFALNDFSSLRYLHRLNREFGGAAVIDLIPALGDPKDLFGGLVRRRASRGAICEAGQSAAHRPAAPPRAARRREDLGMSTPAPRTASLIGAPTDVGASHRGASMGPEALRVAGLHGALTGCGLQVIDCGNVSGPPNPGLPAQRRLSQSAPRWRHGIARCTTPCIGSCAWTGCRSCWAAITA